jgi:predicted transposase YbfD/YdcC
MERVLGVIVDGAKKAYPFSMLKRKPERFEDRIGDKRVFIHFDKRSETGYVTDESGAIVPSIALFWFAWSDFYEDGPLNYLIDTHQTVEKDHGRIETRTYWHLEVPDHLSENQQGCNLQRLDLVQATRDLNGQVTTQVRYYLSSLPVNARRLSEAGRGHWRVENSCHWMLDVVSREDDSRVRTIPGPENLAVLRRLALNLLAQDTSVKRGIKTKRLKAALDDRYLLQILRI